MPTVDRISNDDAVFTRLAQAMRDPRSPQEQAPLVKVASADKCQCESTLHDSDGGCNNPSAMTLNTIYGTFKPCEKCHGDHPVPARDMKKASRDDTYQHSGNTEGCSCDKEKLTSGHGSAMTQPYAETNPKCPLHGKKEGLGTPGCNCGCEYDGRCYRQSGHWESEFPGRPRTSSKSDSIMEGYGFLVTSGLSKRLWDTGNRDCMIMSAMVDAIVENRPEALAKLASSGEDRMKEFMDYMYSTAVVKHSTVADALSYYGNKVGLAIKAEIDDADVDDRDFCKCTNCGKEYSEGMSVGDCCSQKCFDAERSKTAAVKCSECGEEMTEQEIRSSDTMGMGNLCDTCHEEYRGRRADEELFGEASVNLKLTKRAKAKLPSEIKDRVKQANRKKFAKLDSDAKSYFKEIFSDEVSQFDFKIPSVANETGNVYDTNSYRKDTTQEYLKERFETPQRFQTRVEHKLQKGQVKNPLREYDLKPGKKSTKVLEEGQKTVEIIPTYTNSGKVRTNQEAHELRVDLAKTDPTGIGGSWFGAIPHGKEELRKIWDIAEQAGDDGVVDLAAALKSTVRKIRAASSSIAPITTMPELNKEAGGRLPRCSECDGLLPFGSRAKNCESCFMKHYKEQRKSADDACSDCGAEYNASHGAEDCGKKEASIRRGASGYQHCSCRDCMETIVGSGDGPEYCSECEEAGCPDNGGECQSPHSYGGSDSEASRKIKMRRARIDKASGGRLPRCNKCNGILPFGSNASTCDKCLAVPADKTHPYEGKPCRGCGQAKKSVWKSKIGFCDDCSGGGNVIRIPADAKKASHQGLLEGSEVVFSPAISTGEVSHFDYDHDDVVVVDVADDSAAGYGSVYIKRENISSGGDLVPGRRVQFSPPISSGEVHFFDYDNPDVVVLYPHDHVRDSDGRLSILRKRLQLKDRPNFTGSNLEIMTNGQIYTALRKAGLKKLASDFRRSDPSYGDYISWGEDSSSGEGFDAMISTKRDYRDNVGGFFPSGARFGSKENVMEQVSSFGAHSIVTVGDGEEMSWDEFNKIYRGDAWRQEQLAELDRYKDPRPEDVKATVSYLNSIGEKSLARQVRLAFTDKMQNRDVDEFVRDVTAASMGYGGQSTFVRVASSVESLDDYIASGDTIEDWTKNALTAWQLFSPKTQERIATLTEYERFVVANNFRAARALRKKAAIKNIDVHSLSVEAGMLGELALDLIGFIPVAGDISDGVRGLQALKNKDYLKAAFMFISLIPGVGDSVGKGLKWLGKSGKGASPAIRKLLAMLLKNLRHTPKIFKDPEKIKMVANSIGQMEAAVKAKFQEMNAAAQSETAPAQQQLKAAAMPLYEDAVKSPLLEEAHPQPVVLEGFYREDARQAEDMKAATNPPRGKQGNKNLKKKSTKSHVRRARIIVADYDDSQFDDIMSWLATLDHSKRQEVLDVFKDGPIEGVEEVEFDDSSEMERTRPYFVDEDELVERLDSNKGYDIDSDIHDRPISDKDIDELESMRRSSSKKKELRQARIKKAKAEPKKESAEEEEPDEVAEATETVKNFYGKTAARILEVDDGATYSFKSGDEVHWNLDTNAEIKAIVKKVFASQLLVNWGSDNEARIDKSMVKRIIRATEEGGGESIKPSDTDMDPKKCGVCINKKDNWGPSHRGSSMCRNRSSIAAGGTKAHCTCKACF